MNSIINFLEDQSISYAVVRGKYDDLYNKHDKKYVSDLDLVLDCKKNEIFSKINSLKDFQHLEENTFIDLSSKLRIDLYFQSINVGYYHYLKVSSLSFELKKLIELEYIVYLILDPLLKFSTYKKRHIYKLKKYADNYDLNILKNKLQFIIGYSLTNEILHKISNSDFSISKSFIIKCKIRLLFINSNFVRMLVFRLFK